MRRPLAILGLLLVACVGCDASYQMHLSTSVTDARGPAAGLWVFSLAGGDVGARPARTGADGRAEADIRLFLQKPDFIPVAIARDADAIFVAIPGRDFQSKGRFFSSTESDATLTVNFPTVRHELTLDCSTTPCVVSGPPVDGCDLYEIHVDATRAQARYAGYPSAPTARDEPAHGICKFTPENIGPDLAVVEISHGRDGAGLHAFTSNAWRPGT